jgi:hypothetical protein
MNTEIEQLEKDLCKALCAKVVLRPRKDGQIIITTPFKFPDGDGYSIYLKRLPSGGIRLSDMGSTLMHLSYEQDVDRLREGSRLKVYTQILSEMGVHDDDGELFLEAPANQLAQSIFQFGQALTRVHDITLLNRVQVESTFYDDLYHNLSEIISSEKIIKDYVAPNVEKANDYKADFCIIGEKRPLLIFGVPNQTKARLATIVIQYLHSQKFEFKGMVVYSDMTSLPRGDVARLTTAANDQISSIEEFDALRTKVLDSIVA